MSVVVSEEVRAALDTGGPVVALATTIVAHGFPPGDGLEAGRECEARVRATGATPATVAVLDGALRVGLSDAERALIGPAARKVGPRDVGACIALGETGATTGRTDQLRLFYAARGGPPVFQRVETATEAAAIARAHWQVAGSAVVLARPPVDGLHDVEPLIEESLRESAAQGVTGQAVTPFVLAFLHERSGGRTLEVNRRLAADNAALAGEVAAEFSSRW